MKRRRNGRGIITVFVTLIMVPMVAFTGTMVDVARLKLYSAQAAMAADSYGEVVLSEYDNLLKELYGLFAVTQNQEGIDAIEKLAEYTNYSFIPDGDKELDPSRVLEGFMPYKSAEIKVYKEDVKNASLSTDYVLMTQISDFMRFRVIEEAMDASGILSKLEGFEYLSSDMKAAEKRSEITDSSIDALEKIQAYFEILDDISEYSKYSGEAGASDEYLEERTSDYEDYAELLKEVYEGDDYDGTDGQYDYDKYLAYLADKTNIDNAKKAVEEAEEDDEIEVDQATKDLAAKYFDVTAFQTYFDNLFKDYSASSISETTKGIKFGDVGGTFGKNEKLRTAATNVKKSVTTLVNQINELEGQLIYCSPNMQAGIKQDIQDLQEIKDLCESNAFMEVVTALDNNGNATKDTNNKKKWEEKTKKLDDVKKAIRAGTQKDNIWDDEISFEWYNFKSNTEARNLYNELVKLCKKSSSSENGDKKAGEKKVEDAKKKAEEIKEQAGLDKDEETKARNISSELASEFGTITQAADLNNADNSFLSGIAVSTLTRALDRFLVTTYDFGMFSSRVSGIEKPEEDFPLLEGMEGDTPDTEVPAVDTDTEDEEYYDESLTKIRMSKDVNYLYGAEIEYLIAGHNSSVSNLNYTRNSIIAVRMATNFVSTYTIKEIHNAIETIARAAEAAVVATGVAAAAGPIVRIAVSGALRLTVATIESVADWSMLKNREEVIFYKSSLDDLSSKDVVMGFCSDMNDSGSSGSDLDLSKDVDTDKNPVDLSFKLSYEDYLFIMLFFFTSESDILARTSNLITLNVNQSMLGDGEELKELKFKMKDTVTAVKSTCEVNLDFVIVPENFINMFIAGSDTEAIIRKLDNGSYGYSVIRGY